MKLTKPFFYILLLFTIQSRAQTYKVIESTLQYLVIDFEFESEFFVRDSSINNIDFNYISSNSNYFGEIGTPKLPVVTVNVGIPINSKPSLEIIEDHQISFTNKIIMPFTNEDDEDIIKNNPNEYIYNKNDFYPSNYINIENRYNFRYATINSIHISPFKYNPVTRELIFSKYLRIKFYYNQEDNSQYQYYYDNFTLEYLKDETINYEIAKNWTFKFNEGFLQNTLNSNYWYNPNKTYYKIYLSKEGIYRLDYNYLNNFGVPVLGVNIDKIEIFNDELEVPLYITDENNNKIFDQNDYIEFYGTKAKSTEYCYHNIYNLCNTYWLSLEADSSGKRYILKDGYPRSWITTYMKSQTTIHYEVDSLYERLGHTGNNNRDYWYWGKSSGNAGHLYSFFDGLFPYPKNLSIYTNNLTIRVNMHGMSFNSCNPDHKVKFLLTSQPIGEHTWDGPSLSTFETSININQIGLFDINGLQVAAYGDIEPCGSDSSQIDEIRINWFELEYEQDHKADSNYFSFQSPISAQGNIRFGVYNWYRDSMLVFVPEKQKLIRNVEITNNEFKTVLFQDSVTSKSKYFCLSKDYKQFPDSISIDLSSNLRNISNGADVIIITHQDFLEAAESYKNFRLQNFSDTSITNPRIEIIEINQIYDEFSSGLTDPFAIQQFIKYAFENWQAPAPTYVVLIGDMSYDYRQLIPSSRKNFIPSIPYHTLNYGQAASDNMFVCVVGINDVIPDLAIGRLSCETKDEAELLVNKIINYPADNGKVWKQNVLLISSGLDAVDESRLRFNDANFDLDTIYLRKVGIISEKVFRYPNRPEHYIYQGDGPEIRDGFNRGAIMANYYGHGGGYQWDLVFNNDDIYQLNNSGRQPFITSVTCYTAHFDNQDVFGEQFNKVIDKGSIAFFGSSGLTYYEIGKKINEEVYKQIFSKNNHIIGKAILKAKGTFTPGTITNGQIALQTLLGDPLLKLAFPDKPDFKVLSEDIKFSSLVPVKNDSIYIKTYFNNLGITFPNDSVKIELFINSPDTSYELPSKKLASFGEYDSLTFIWSPNKGGLYSITVKINDDLHILEDDISDNQTSVYLTVYDLDAPNIIFPQNGVVLQDSKIDFLFADNGYYISNDLKYSIQIDTSLGFENPLINSENILASDGKLMWTSPDMPAGNYFWRARIFTEIDSSKWSNIFTFTINPQLHKPGYFISDKSLKSFSLSNIFYSDTLNSLILNTNYLPPKPSTKTFIEDITFPIPNDLQNLSTITTDGKYLYVAHMAYYSGPSKIFKVGTGYNGTIKGQVYDPIPNVLVPIWHQIFYLNGNIFVPTGDAYSLLKINPENGDTSRIQIPDGMLNSTTSIVEKGAFYLTSDGVFVYNVAYINNNGDFKYKIRVFDPNNNWSKIKDIVTSDNSFANFCGFFVAQGYFYPYENFFDELFRRINLETGFYEEEWLSFLPHKGFYAWTYDWTHDEIYGTVFKANHDPSITKFHGSYTDASGSFQTHVIGPGIKWNEINYTLDNQNSTGSYIARLEGLNNISKDWDILFSNLPQHFELNIDSTLYNYIKLNFFLVDSSLGAGDPLKFKDLQVDYEMPPEIFINKESIQFSPDSLMQGYPVLLNSNITNLSNSDTDSLTIYYYLKSEGVIDSDTLIVYRRISIPADTTISFLDTISTSQLLFNSSIKLVADYKQKEMYSFNNLYSNSFYTLRDTVRPNFSITFDGKELIDGDIISSAPVVIMTLEDNSPLPLSPNLFSIQHNNESLNFYNLSDSLLWDYTPYPNSKATVTWKPKLEDGLHTLAVFVKDSSGNPYSSTSLSFRFYVYNNPDLLQVYNYPNPFKDKTDFTFELRGIIPPEELKIKVFTVAGRLIKELIIPGSTLQIGFNRIPWDGKDQDGDEIANGVYFYKIISKHGDETKVTTQKLAKLK